MKKILVAMFLVGLVAAGCNSSTSVKNETEVVQEGNWKVYTNSQYGFQLTFPNDNWKGYKVFEKADQDFLGAKHLYFAVSTKADYTVLPDVISSKGYAAPFTISVYPTNLWSKVSQEGGLVPVKLGENSKYVFSYSTWQDSPEDLIKLNTDIDLIVKSFKLSDSQ